MRGCLRPCTAQGKGAGVTGYADLFLCIILSQGADSLRSAVSRKEGRGRVRDEGRRPNSKQPDSAKQKQHILVTTLLLKSKRSN